MTTPAHTPGPWKQSHLNSYWIDVPESSADLRKYGSGDIRCYHANAEADARLIAAAPDLLAALEDIFEHCCLVHRRWGDDSNQKESDAAERAGKAAIKKAKGGTMSANSIELKAPTRSEIQAQINRDCDEAKQSQDVTNTKNPVAFRWWLESMSGAGFILFKEKHHTDQDIRDAKRFLYNSRDVVTIRIKEVK